MFSETSWVPVTRDIFWSQYKKKWPLRWRTAQHENRPSVREHCCPPLAEQCVASWIECSHLRIQWANAYMPSLPNFSLVSCLRECSVRSPENCTQPHSAGVPSTKCLEKQMAPFLTSCTIPPLWFDFCCKVRSYLMKKCICIGKSHSMFTFLFVTISQIRTRLG